MNKVLILGSGMIAAPLVDYILSKNLNLTIASTNLERAKKLIGANIKAKAVFCDANNTKQLHELIEQTDIVINILPNQHNFTVAQICIDCKKNMVTTSYSTPEVEQLNKKAEKAGIVIINECGFEPGLDHMSAKRIIDTVHGFGGTVTKFYSLSGALPAPGFEADNPFYYKFSWSPSSVLNAAQSSARYIKNNIEVNIPAGNILKTPIKTTILPVGNFEVYPNRDVLKYKELYKIPHAVTMFRGTLRYPGWCQSVGALIQLGLFDTNKTNSGNLSPVSLLQKVLKLKNATNIKHETAKQLNTNIDSNQIKALEFLGFFTEQNTILNGDTYFDMVKNLMAKKMQLTTTDRDMSILQHQISAQYPDGRHEIITSQLIDYGTTGNQTSVARLVAMPIACAAKLIIDNEILTKGVQIPVLPDIYNPILIELENEGIELVEHYGLPLSNDILP